MTEQHIVPATAAAELLTWLEAHGAIVRLHRGHVRTDLNPIQGLTRQRAEALAAVILALRDELRAILRARRVIH